MIRLMLGFVVAAVAVTGGAAAQSAIERGDYLVNTILTCGNCHTPRGPGGGVRHEQATVRRAADLG